MEHVIDLASEISESSSMVSEDLRTLDGSVDGEPRADGLYEERFRVDRRKLESMLLGIETAFCSCMHKLQACVYLMFPAVSLNNS